MATDKERLAALFTEFGLGFDQTTKRITVDENHDKVDALGLFYCDFHFDADGKFEQLEIAE